MCLLLAVPEHDDVIGQDGHRLVDDLLGGGIPPLQVGQLALCRMKKQCVGLSRNFLNLINPEFFLLIYKTI